MQIQINTVKEIISRSDLVYYCLLFTFLRLQMQCSIGSPVNNLLGFILFVLCNPLKHFCKTNPLLIAFNHCNIHDTLMVLIEIFHFTILALKDFFITGGKDFDLQIIVMTQSYPFSS